jgi:hypothetical protein
MTRPRTLLLLLSAILAGACGVALHCSSLTSQIAGSTGTGNPSASITLAIVADTVQPLMKPANTAPGYAGLLKENADALLPKFTIRDDNGFCMRVQSARWTVREIRFLFDTSVNCALLPSIFASRINCDSNYISIPGPFTFDLLNGTCEPPLDTVKLPEAKYSGVELLTGLSHQGGSVDTLSSALCCCPFEIRGTFDYNATSRYFLLCLGYRETVFYNLSALPATVTRSDTANFLIWLDARRWLSALTLKDCIDNGFIPLDNAGNLAIDGYASGAGPCSRIDERIRDNILYSGNLRVKP